MVYYFQQWFAWLICNFYSEMKVHMLEMQHYKMISEMYSIIKQHILTSLVSSALGLSLHKSLVLTKSQYIICCKITFRTTPEVQAMLQQLCDVMQLVKKIGKCMSNVTLRCFWIFVSLTLVRLSYHLVQCGHTFCCSQLYMYYRKLLLLFGSISIFN